MKPFMFKSTPAGPVGPQRMSASFADRRPLSSDEQKLIASVLEDLASFCAFSKQGNDLAGFLNESLKASLGQDNFSLVTSQTPQFQKLISGEYDTSGSTVMNPEIQMLSSGKRPLTKGRIDELVKMVNGR